MPGDHGPHNPECATARNAECYCACRGRGHGIAFMPGSLKNKMHDSDVSIKAVRGGNGKHKYYVVLTQDGKSPGGHAVETLRQGDHIDDKPKSRKEAVAARAAAVKVTGETGKPAEADQAIPAGPLTALLDIDNDFTVERLLEHLADGDGSDGQRRDLVEALSAFKSLSGAALAARWAGSSHHYSAAIRADSKRYSSFRDRVEIEGGDARAFLKKHWDKFTTPQGKAAALNYVWGREREHGPNRRREGMATGPQFASNTEAQAWANKHMKAPDLHASERKAVYDYTDSAYTEINTHLRKGMFLAADLKKHLPYLSQAIGKSKAPEDLLLKRGEGSAFLEKLGGNSDDPKTLTKLVGKVAADEAFTSTSIGMTPAMGNEVEWVIRVPKGHPALYVDNPGDNLTFHQGEREVLLDRGTRRVIHAVYRHPDPKVRKVYIEAEVVPDDWKKPAGWKPSPRGDAWKNNLNYF